MMEEKTENRFWRMFDRLGQFGTFVVWTAAILVVSMLTSYFPLWINVPVNVILPVIVLVKLKMVMFEKLKLTTLVVMRAMILLPLFGVISGKWFVNLILIFLVINCMEATLTDLLKNHQPYNFVTGLFLSASVLALSGEWFGGVTGPFSGIYTFNAGHFGGALFTTDKVVLIGTICWFVAYTIWNWLFVVGEFSPAVGYLHIGILLSPILSVLLTLDPGLWLVFRANSLTCGGVFQIACKKQVEKRLANDRLAKFIEKVKSRPVQIGCMIVNLALIAVPVVIFFL
ncbi:MAG: hypothetical protein Q4G07_02985 [Oscillospiraceae bacterium]|nr:hypothetical protein [Oscillospiraceae bacterium]